MHRLASATVIAADLAVADACSTAAAAHGPKAMGWLAQASGVEAMLTLKSELLTTAGWPGLPLSLPSAG